MVKSDIFALIIPALKFTRKSEIELEEALNLQRLEISLTLSLRIQKRIDWRSHK